jgi:hypothetical protein
MWIEKTINMLTFRKLFITLICIGTICFSFTIVTTGDDRTGKETIQLPLPPATKKEEIKLSEDSEKKDVSEPEETTQPPLPSATKKEEIKLPGENKKKNASALEKATIELTTGTREITPESQGEPGDGELGMIISARSIVRTVVDRSPILLILAQRSPISI